MNINITITDGEPAPAEGDLNVRVPVDVPLNLSDKRQIRDVMDYVSRSVREAYAVRTPDHIAVHNGLLVEISTVDDDDEE